MVRKIKLPSLLKSKLIRPLQAFLAQGLSCEKLALSIALGLVLGTFPVLGITTVLCMLTALALRLNMPVIQFANYFAYPLQIVLLVPYYNLGGLVFNARHNVNLDTLKNLLTGNNYKEIITMLSDSTLNAIGAWLLISPLALALLYTGLRPVLVRLKSNASRSKLRRRS
jgi:uncharacterized protein (DUF2062 family)